MIDKIPKLKSKEDCEKQLAVEIALGAVASVDALIEQGHEVACEYGCQLYFDDIRNRISERSKLPITVVQHLIHDRVDKIRLNTIGNNWESLTADQQQEFLEGADEMLMAVEDKSNLWYSYNNSVSDNCRNVATIIWNRLKDAIQRRDEDEAMWFLDMVGLRNKLPDLNKGIDRTDALKHMPNLLRRYWTALGKDTYTNMILFTVHPDEDVRMAEVKRILDKKTRVAHLGQWQESIGVAEQGETLKGNILLKWVHDDSVAIRKLIASTTTAVEVLGPLSNDENTEVAKIAGPRFKRFTKRREYSKKYAPAYQRKKKIEAQKKQHARREEQRRLHEKFQKELEMRRQQEREMRR